MNKIFNIIRGWFYRFTNKNNYLFKTRFDICNTCDKKIKILGDDYCSMCGCALRAKCRVKDEKCLNGKW